MAALKLTTFEITCRDENEKCFQVKSKHIGQGTMIGKMARKIPVCRLR
jgi:hypothetical protein